jgi:hypothetical protein
MSTEAAEGINHKKPEITTMDRRYCGIQKDGLK